MKSVAGNSTSWSMWLKDLPGFLRWTHDGRRLRRMHRQSRARSRMPQDFAAQIAERYLQKTGINPQVYLCTAEDGAGELSLERV